MATWKSPNSRSSNPDILQQGGTESSEQQQHQRQQQEIRGYRQEEIKTTIAEGLADDLDDDDDDDDEDACSSLADSVAWHEDDLIVAAELGKALLERNRRLESRLRRARATCQERARESALLASRLAALRRLDEGRARACDEVERHCAELEQRNDQLRAEQRRCQQRIETLVSAEAAAEARAEDLRLQLTAALTAAAAEKKATPTTFDIARFRREGSRCRRLSWSGASRDLERDLDSGLDRDLDSDLNHPPLRTPPKTKDGGACGRPGRIQPRERPQHRHRDAAPSAPPPTNRRLAAVEEPAVEDSNARVYGGAVVAVSRDERVRLASGCHEPAYRALFAEARARLREVMQQQQQQQQQHQRLENDG